MEWQGGIMIFFFLQNLYNKTLVTNTQVIYMYAIKRIIYSKEFIILFCDLKLAFKNQII